VQGIKSAEDIAVYVDAVPGRKFDAPAEHVVIDQKKMTFVPHVTVIMQGTTVDFLNSDPVGHNVYWPSISGNKKLAHNMGNLAQGQKKSFQFSDLGAAPLLCNVHPEMSGYAVIVPTLFRITDKEGNYTSRTSSRALHDADMERGRQTHHAVGGCQCGTATVDITVKK